MKYCAGFHAEPLALVERAAAVYLGIKAYGVHINGFTVTQRGEEMWVATRSLKKPTWPGKLDHIVAGGQACALPSAPHLCRTLQGTQLRAQHTGMLQLLHGKSERWPAGQHWWLTEGKEGLVRL